jgi:hypothetical protein
MDKRKKGNGERGTGNRGKPVTEPVEVSGGEWAEEEGV